MAAESANNSISDKSDVFNELDKLEKGINILKNQLVVNSFRTIKTIAKDAEDYVNSIIKRRDENKKTIGLPSGLNKLDDALGGFVPSRYYVCGARTSKGKSALAASIIRNQLFDYNLRIGILSGEMGDIDLLLRIAFMNAQINRQILNNLQFTNSQANILKSEIRRIKDKGLVISSPPKLMQKDLRTQLNRMVLDEGCEMVYIDHATAVKLSGNSQKWNQGYSDVSKEIQSLAKELKVPIWTNAQLNRMADTRADRKPYMSDLKESGSFEEDANVVMLIWRPEHDGIDTFMPYSEMSKSKARILIPKNRDGKTGYAQIGFINAYAWFVNEDEVHNPPNTRDIQQSILGGDDEKPF
jgi:replicative DNA helicase